MAKPSRFTRGFEWIGRFHTIHWICQGLVGAGVITFLDGVIQRLSRSQIDWIGLGILFLICLVIFLAAGFIRKRGISGQLVIINAEYGSDAKSVWKNVTNVVNSMITTGNLTIEGKYNDLFPPDPIRSEPKELKIDFLWNGRKFSITVPEDHKFTLPLK